MYTGRVIWVSHAGGFGSKPFTAAGFWNQRKECRRMSHTVAVCGRIGRCRNDQPTWTYAVEESVEALLEEVDLPPGEAMEEINIDRPLFKLQDGIALVPAEKTLYDIIVTNPLASGAVV